MNFKTVFKKSINFNDNIKDKFEFDFEQFLSLSN